jgi:hypothetical protein
MSIKLFRNRDVFNSVLEYDTSAGPLKEGSASNVQEERIAKLGNYIKLNGMYYGVYATPNGPCFFYQNDEFLINDPGSVFQHTKGDVQHNFRFIYKGQVVIDLNYDHWDDLNIDPWSDEEFIDFFIWLTKVSSNQEIINMWTE